MIRVCEREQKDDGDNVGDVAQNRRKRGLEGEYYEEIGEDDVEDGEQVTARTTCMTSSLRLKRNSTRPAKKKEDSCM